MKVHDATRDWTDRDEVKVNYRRLLERKAYRDCQGRRQEQEDAAMGIVACIIIAAFVALIVIIINQITG